MVEYGKRTADARKLDERVVFVEVNTKTVEVFFRISSLVADSDRKFGK